MSEYLYLAAFAYGDLKIAKIGTTSTPRNRIQSVFSTSPFPMSEMLLYRFQTRGEAAAWERDILTRANRYADRGEWVIDDAVLRDIWRNVSGGDPVTLDDTKAPKGRPLTHDADASRAAVFIERFRARVGPVTASKVKYSGHPALFDRAVIKARLIEGYGIEDIAILDQISTSNIRREIARLRLKGELVEIYTPDPSRSRQPDPAKNAGAV